MTTLRRCPKCRSAAIVFYEGWGYRLPFEQTESGKARRIWGTPEHEPCGGVNCECKGCDHKWTPRGLPWLDIEKVGDDEDIVSDPTIKPAAKP